MKLKDIMTKNVATVSLESNVLEAARKMRDLNIGAVPVVDGDRPVGIITDRDIVLRCVAEEKEAGTVKASEIMTKKIISAEPETNVEEAAKIMAEHQIRRLPIVENGKLVGIVSLGDLATKPRFADEAGEALTNISIPT